FFADPLYWPEVWYDNPSIKDPHLIYPGDTLVLKWQHGVPHIEYPPSRAASADASVSPVPSVDPLLLPHLAQDTLIEKARLVALPRVLGSTEGRRLLSTQDSVYIDAALHSTDWQVYRVAHTFSSRRPEQAIDNPPEMVSLTHVANGSVTGVASNYSVMTLTEVNQEVRPNDVLLPVPEYSKTQFWPHPATTKTTLLGHLYGSEYVAQGQLVVLDKGSKAQVSAGQVFQVTQPGKQVMNQPGDYRYQAQGSKALSKTILLPSVKIGEVMVIRTYPWMSLAVVKQATQPMKAGMHAVPPSNARVNHE
ncbi:LysM peptidoglycan-binding domain-containing protein, partial [Salinivibrio socompensis]|uniref:LysM peptidoglycan-binding domain-containing protein n=1 Tax=Salinivibrio socompensis TaxID=1510206 RepID=UPI0004718DDC